MKKNDFSPAFLSDRGKMCGWEIYVSQHISARSQLRRCVGVKCTRATTSAVVPMRVPQPRAPSTQQRATKCTRPGPRPTIGNPPTREASHQVFFPGKPGCGDGHLVCSAVQFGIVNAWRKDENIFGLYVRRRVFVSNCAEEYRVATPCGLRPAKGVFPKTDCVRSERSSYTEK